MGAVASPTHRASAARLRAWLAAEDRHRDLLAVGAYAAGADPELDRLLERRAEVEAFLSQPADEAEPFERTLARLEALVR
jgi:flagellar biosynthesis/type III secretory pathway ATPase